jgi:hypothetical protein
LHPVWQAETYERRLGERVVAPPDPPRDNDDRRFPKHDLEDPEPVVGVDARRVDAWSAVDVVAPAVARDQDVIVAAALEDVVAAEAADRVVALRRPKPRTARRPRGRR